MTKYDQTQPDKSFTPEQRISEWQRAGETSELSPAHREAYRQLVRIPPLDQGFAKAFFGTPEFEGLDDKSAPAPEKKSSRTIEDVAKGFEKAVKANGDLGPARKELAAIALSAYQQGGWQALDDMQKSLNKAIDPQISIELSVTGPKNRTSIEIRTVKEISRDERKENRNKTEAELDEQGLVRTKDSGIAKKLTLDRVNVPETAPDKLKPAVDSVIRAIIDPMGEVKDRGNKTAEKIRDAINSGIPLRDLLEAVNKGLPADKRPKLDDAVTTRTTNGKTSVIVFPGEVDQVRGFEIIVTKKDDKWSAECTYP